MGAHDLFSAPVDVMEAAEFGDASIEVGRIGRRAAKTLQIEQGAQLEDRRTYLPGATCSPL